MVGSLLDDVRVAKHLTENNNARILPGIAHWDIAQLVEHLSYTQQVPGSIPGVPITPPEVYPAESITADGRLISRRLGG